MLENFLSHVRDNVSKKIEQSIGNSNFIEKVMRYTALSKSKMIRAGLICLLYTSPSPRDDR